MRRATPTLVQFAAKTPYRARPGQRVEPVFDFDRVPPDVESGQMRTLTVLLFFVLVCGMGPGVAQAPPLQSANSPQPSDFQAKIDAAALVFRDSDPRLKGASPEYLRGLAEFV